MTALDTCAQAIAGVRKRYSLHRNADQSVAVNDHEQDCHVFFGTRVECQAWIDREAARACRDAWLKDAVTEVTVVQAVAKTLAENADVIFDDWRDNRAPAVQVLTTIQHIVNEGE